VVNLVPKITYLQEVPQRLTDTWLAATVLRLCSASASDRQVLQCVGNAAYVELLHAVMSTIKGSSGCAGLGPVAAANASYQVLPDLISTQNKHQDVPEMQL
jgi:hypothetical protein